MKLFGRKSEEKDKYAGLEALYKAHRQEWRRLLLVVIDRHMQTIHAPGGGLERAKSEADFTQFGMARSYLDALDDVEFEVVEQALFAEPPNLRKGGIIDTGNGEAVQRWIVSGVHRRPLLGFPPSGERIEIPGVTYLLVKNDAVRSEWTYWELPALTAQMAAAST